MKETNDERIRKFLSWVGEAQLGHQVWRSESWEDAAFKDGLHWNSADIELMKNKGINALTINKVFPVLNILLGSYILNQKDIVAKGRTKRDGELSQTMSEGIAFVNDQNNGTFLQRSAFEDQITAGFGCLDLGFNPDPRRERIQVKQQPWHAVWWDPYSSPWMEKETCRYAFTASWKDKEDLKILFPEKEKDIDEIADELWSRTTDQPIIDENTEIEEFKSMLMSTFWIRGSRQRVRPVELWYPKTVVSTFARMNDGMVHDISEMDIREAVQIVEYAREIIKVPVKKMWVSTFLNGLELQHVRSPYIHDEYPYIPFVGYLDRFGQPYGVPRQIKEQNMEVNKRRSMSLALINSRRVIAEEGSMRNEKEAFVEANRHDGYIILKKDKMKKFVIEDMSKLAAPQIDLMLQSEREISEIAGPNTELQRDIPAQSGVALEQRRQNTSTVTASLLDNARRSQKMLGEKMIALIQSEWTEEKVLRVVDRLTGAEKFSVINERIYNEQAGAIEIKNDITQGRYDVIVTSKPMTDAMREKNMELLFAAINKASPEMMPILLNMAFELSDLPDKDGLLEQLRAATNTPPIDPSLTKDEREAQLRQNETIQQQKQEELEQLDKADKIASLDEKRAKTAAAQVEAQAKLIDANANKAKVDQDGWLRGQELALELLQGGKKDDTGTGSSIRKKG